VGFSYKQKETLKDISFKVPEKSMTALVGASGSGKTTIANLIVRFWDVQRGEVLIGGKNVKEMTCDSLLKNIASWTKPPRMLTRTTKNIFRRR
jgi:ATP-binding cassette subfamily B protein